MGSERDCLSDHIRRVLSDRIISGVLKPGERLIELKLAEEFHSSQTPVREALRELESLRLVECLPYRGTRVREVGEREMSEAYAVRGALERLAAESAAAMLRNDVASLRKSAAGIARAARRRDREGYAKHDLDFHRAIITASGNRTLTSMWESLAFETRTRITLARAKYDWAAIAGLHDRIVDALEVGDGPTAGRLLEAHARLFTTTTTEKREESMP
jgi:DNA-binding GntR family transcriptional regulator